MWRAYQYITFYAPHLVCLAFIVHCGGDDDVAGVFLLWVACHLRVYAICTHVWCVVVVVETVIYAVYLKTIWERGDEEGTTAESARLREDG